MIVGHIGGGSSGGYEIQKSLRFRSAAGAVLTRTPAANGNRTRWTLSTWIKLGVVAQRFPILESYFDASNMYGVQISTTGAVSVFDYNAAAYRVNIATTALLRDPSAHYHLQVVWDTAQATSTDRVKVYINGVLQTSFSTTTYPALNLQGGVNTNYLHRLGRNAIGGSNVSADGYLSEINFVDGQALGPENFGEFSAETGVWIPKKYTGTYGTNGFYLPFHDGSNLTELTKDRSGNNNNWTATNISLTAGATYDWMDDTPTNNFAVLNPLAVSASAATMSNGNLSATCIVVGGGNAFATIALPSSGKFYWEITPTSLSGDGLIGVGTISAASSYFWQNTDGSLAYYSATGARYLNNSFVAYGATYAANDVVGVAADIDAGTVTFYKNNASQGVITFNAAGLFPAVGDGSGSFASNFNANFGQRPFAYTPPTGFKALCTKNLPAPAIANPKLHFDVVLAAGANIKTTSEAVFPSNFFEWIKDRGNSNNHQLIDIVRGTNVVLQSNTTAAETTYTAPAGSSVGWVWKAGGAPVTNNAGSASSQVSVNQQAGFSIVTYIGQGSARTVGHGLGVAPKLIVVKNTNGSPTYPMWATYHASLGANNYLSLNTANAVNADGSVWNNTAPTSSVFSVGISMAQTCSYVAYCFAEIPGFSRIGSYTGNGNADGPFVWCGFRPRFVMIKRTDVAGQSWLIEDSSRNSLNPTGLDLIANGSDAEANNTPVMDFTSNGFKMRNTFGGYNTSGGTYIFIAFAEAPFQYANAR